MPVSASNIHAMYVMYHYIPSVYVVHSETCLLVTTCVLGKGSKGQDDLLMKRNSHCWYLAVWFQVARVAHKLLVRYVSPQYTQSIRHRFQVLLACKILVTDVGPIKSFQLQL